MIDIQASGEIGLEYYDRFSISLLRGDMKISFLNHALTDLTFARKTNKRENQIKLHRVLSRVVCEVDEYGVSMRRS